MKKVIKNLCCLICLMIVVGGPSVALAETSLVNPLTGNTSSIAVEDLIARVIKIALSFVGALALLMFIVGGFTWLTSAGAEAKIKKGRDIMIWATLGLLVIFASYIIVNAVFTALGSVGAK